VDATQLALSGQAREDYLQSIKAYGEYFVKPGSSRQEWQRDWVACGGWPDGQFSGGAPNGSPTTEIFAAIDRAKNSLNTCMKSRVMNTEKLDKTNQGLAKSR
jgi:hypothetical protein